MQLWTKKVVTTRVTNDPVNFKTFPISDLLIFIILLFFYVRIHEISPCALFVIPSVAEGSPTAINPHR